jgi:hypothetical protein
MEILSMTRRTSRAEMPPDPASVIHALRPCREAMIGVQGKVKINGPVYHGAAMVIAAIDAMATLLTGHRYYFAIEGSVAPEARLLESEEPVMREDGPDLQ